MKNVIELSNYSVFELSFEDQIAIDGGSFWEKLGEALGYVAGILVVGVIVSLIIITA